MAPSRRSAMYNTPAIRTGGFGALQVEALTNRPASIARRHLAASTLRMRSIEPDELTSSEWVRFLVMEPRERDRFIDHFLLIRSRRRDSSAGSSGSEAALASSASRSKAEEAEEESEVDGSGSVRVRAPAGGREVASRSSSFPSSPSFSTSRGTGTTPLVSLWARQLDNDDDDDGGSDERSPGRIVISGREGFRALSRQGHARRAADDWEAAPPPPAYSSIIGPPPAYVPRPS